MYEYLPLFGMGYPEKMHTMTGRTTTIACTVQFVWKETKGIQSMVIYFNTSVKNEKGDAIIMCKESRGVTGTTVQRTKAVVLNKSSPSNKRRRVSFDMS